MITNYEVGLHGMISHDPIQVLMVYYEPCVSGQTTHVLSLAKGLDPVKFKIRVFLPILLKSVVDQFKEAGAEVILAPFRKTYWKMAAIRSLFQQIRVNPNAIVHIHSQEAALIGRPLAKLAGARHILYTPQTIDIRQKTFQKVYSTLEVISAHITEKILSVNEADRLRLISWGIPAEKIVSIYNGVDLAQFQTIPDRVELRRALGLHPNGPLVMQIGRMSKQKSPFDFIEGATIVHQTRPGVQFMMIGDGPLLVDVRQKVHDLGLEDIIKVAGAVDHAYRFIPAADILTLTSLWEGSPYSLLEAMAFSKPVVATEVNGCPEIIGPEQCGLLVPPGNPQMWAKAVEDLIDHPQKACMLGQNGRRRLEENFTLPTTIHKIEVLYTQSANSLSK
jgi:glycosyltransferase involved in cell wall biosynthesis